MLEQDPSKGEFWCPVGEKRPPRPDLDMTPGDWAALHWDWACDRLDERRLGFLRAATRRQLDLVNHDLRPGPAAILS